MATEMSARDSNVVGSTRNHKGSPADACRERGWGPGTVLVGDEGYGPSVIKITAVGDHKLLAKCLGHSGGAVAAHEISWVLWCRDWREATAEDVPVPFEPGEQVQMRKQPFLAGTVESGPDYGGCYVIRVGDRKAVIPNPVRTQQIVGGGADTRKASASPATVETIPPPASSKEGQWRR